MEAVTDKPETLPKGFLFKDAIEAAQTREELVAIADKMNLLVDGRMNLENAKKALVDSYKSMIKESQRITKEATGHQKEQGDPVVKIKFGIRDIMNPDEAPLFQFNFDCGKGVKAQETIPLWSFMHGQEYEVPYAVYEHLNSLTIPRSRWVEDPLSPGGTRCVHYQQKRFDCELLMTKEQILQLQKT